MWTCERCNHQTPTGVEHVCAPVPASGPSAPTCPCEQIREVMRNTICKGCGRTYETALAAARSLPVVQPGDVPALPEITDEEIVGIFQPPNDDMNEQEARLFVAFKRTEVERIRALLARNIRGPLATPDGGYGDETL